jgi:hypothetical protein
MANPAHWHPVFVQLATREKRVLSRHLVVGFAPTRRGSMSLQHSGARRVSVAPVQSLGFQPCEGALGQKTLLAIAHVNVSLRHDLLDSVR